LNPAGRVLVVDDDSDICLLLRSFLGQEGYLVRTVETGQLALEAVHEFAPDVILVDMVMPGLSGADVLIALLRAHITVPVILITGHDVVVGSAFFAVLTKPFDFPRMADTVRAALDHSRPAFLEVPRGTSQPPEASDCRHSRAGSQ
jgi:DNA-binding response OmpR family regulator